VAVGVGGYWVAPPVRFDTWVAAVVTLAGTKESVYGVGGYACSPTPGVDGVPVVPLAAPVHFSFRVDHGNGFALR